MKISNSYQSIEVHPRDWEKECQKIGYSYPALKKLIRTQGEAIIKALTANYEFYVEVTRNAPFVKKLSEFLTRRIEHHTGGF